MFLRVCSTVGVRHWVLLGACVATALLCVEPVSGQLNRRGFSSRGINPVGSRTSNLRGPVIYGASRPSYNSAYGTYSRGPLNMSSGYFSDLVPFAAGAAAAQNELGGMGDASASDSAASGTRPNIRPRLELGVRDAVTSQVVLRSVQVEVRERIAGCPEPPLSSSWFAAHSDIVPLVANAASSAALTDWESAAQLLGTGQPPHSYDFRPDDLGIIYAFRDGAMQRRAVDLRSEAVALASTKGSSDTPADRRLLGVFAAVPPTDEPVESLLQFALDQTGTLTGYRYEFATQTVQPLQGAWDADTQQVAWRVGDDYALAGLKNMTDDVARCLLFRADGWTQPWILMRVGEP